MDSQLELEGILKKKGIGPQGSKSLKPEAIERIEQLWLSEEVSITTKATLLTALLTLAPNPHEKALIDRLAEDYNSLLPQQLHPFFAKAVPKTFQYYINKCIAHYHLNAKESAEAMSAFFNSEEPEYLKGAFLEAQRLKRETREENRVFFKEMSARANKQVVHVPVLIDLCDSYDGCVRLAPYTLFTAVCLAAAGYPSVIHGLDTVAPKQGLTQHQLLAEAGKITDGSLLEARKRLEDKSIGWAYVDQSVANSSLHDLKKMRKEMVKRPFLATFEKLLQPLVAEQNIIVTSYTHAHYKDEVVELLTELDSVHQVIHLKGAEATTMPALSRTTPYMYWNGSSIQEKQAEASDFEIDIVSAKKYEKINACEVLEEGIEALQGIKNYARQQIIYQGALILHNVFELEKREAVVKMEQVIDEGIALAHWNK